MNAFLFFKGAVAGRRMTSLPAIQGNRVYIDKVRTKLTGLNFAHIITAGATIASFINSGTCCSTFLFSLSTQSNGTAKATRFEKKDTTLVTNSEYQEDYINRLTSLPVLLSHLCCSNKLFGICCLDPKLGWHCPRVSRLSIEAFEA